MPRAYKWTPATGTVLGSYQANINDYHPVIWSKMTCDLGEIVIAQ